MNWWLAIGVFANLKCMEKISLRGTQRALENWEQIPALNRKILIWAVLAAVSFGLAF